VELQHPIGTFVATLGYAVASRIFTAQILAIVLLLLRSRIDWGIEEKNYANNKVIAR
jgi:hypothetical protein